MLTLPIGQREADGRPECQHHGSSSRRRRNPNLTRPQRHGQDDTNREGRDFDHERRQHDAEGYERHASRRKDAGRPQLGSGCRSG